MGAGDDWSDSYFESYLELLIESLYFRADFLYGNVAVDGGGGGGATAEAAVLEDS